MDSKSLMDVTENWSAHNYHPLPVVIAKAEGAVVEDPERRRYFDFLSAYSAVNQGHCHPRIIGAMIEQAKRCTLTSRAFYNDQMGPYLQELCALTQMEMALPMNTGVEAVETAIKAARRWAYRIKGVAQDQAEIIVLDQNFHGRTTTVVSFSTDEGARGDFGPYTPGFKVVPFGDIEAFKKAIGPNTAGFLFEPIQGEAGVNVLPEGYLQEAARICHEQNVLMMADEIQTGLGRTGKWFCCEHFGVKPDLMILGKALGGGVLPVSAVVGSKEVMGVFDYGSHGSTFGGNPLASRVALEALHVLKDEKLVERSAELGEWFQAELVKIDSPAVDHIRGKGLMIGVVLNRKARPFCESLLKKGLLCKETHQNIIRFAPPLVIRREDLETCLKLIREVLTDSELNA